MREPHARADVVGVRRQHRAEELIRLFVLPAQELDKSAYDPTPGGGIVRHCRTDGARGFVVVAGVEVIQRRGEDRILADSRRSAIAFSKVGQPGTDGGDASGDPEPPTIRQRSGPRRVDLCALEVADAEARKGRIGLRFQLERHRVGGGHQRVGGLVAFAHLVIQDPQRLVRTSPVSVLPAIEVREIVDGLGESRFGALQFPLVPIRATEVHLRVLDDVDVAWISR